MATELERALERGDVLGVLDTLERCDAEFVAAPHRRALLLPFARFVSDHVQVEASAHRALSPEAQPSSAVRALYARLVPVIARLTGASASSRDSAAVHLSLVRLHLAFDALDAAFAHYERTLPRMDRAPRTVARGQASLLLAAIAAGDRARVPRLRRRLLGSVTGAHRLPPPPPLEVIRALLTSASTAEEVHESVTLLRQRVIMRRELELEVREMLDWAVERWPNVRGLRELSVHLTPLSRSTDLQLSMTPIKQSDALRLEMLARGRENGAKQPDDGRKREKTSLSRPGDRI